MKIRIIISFILIALSLASCKKDHKEIDLSEVMTQLKIEGRFKSVDYEFLRNLNQDANDIIKVTLENGENINKEKFSKKAAKAIFHSNKLVNNYKEIWISIKSEKTVFFASAKTTQLYQFKINELKKS